MNTLTRRGFMGLASFAGLGALAPQRVTVSHGNSARANELLTLHPTLANAAWDWGFCDWETALGAASRMGNTVELPSELAACFAGSHAFGVRDTDRIAITIEKGAARF